MAATNVVTTRNRSRVVSEAALFAATLAGFVVWQLGGHIDAWYHAHYGFEIESFLTWPHALLYAGWVATAAPSAAYLFESAAQGESRSRLLPPGYPLVLVGAVVFGIGGAFDFAWHASFGFEVGHEALVSPSHLVLIYGAGLGCVGLAWAAIDRRRRMAAPSLAADIATAVSIGILFRVSLFMLLYSQPFTVDYASGGAIAGALYGFGGIAGWDDMTAQIAGTTGMVLYAMLLALFIVVPLRRLRLPSGFITIVVLWSAVINTVGVPEMSIYVPALVGSAVVGEIIWAAMGRGAFGGRDRRAGYWAIAFALPATQLYLYFGLMAAFGGGVEWSTSLWTGAPILAGVYGLAASVFAIPPSFVRAGSGGGD